MVNSGALAKIFNAIPSKPLSALAELRTIIYDKAMLDLSQLLPPYNSHRAHHILSA